MVISFFVLVFVLPARPPAARIYRLAKELNRTCRAMQQRVVELISRVSNEEVTEELLHVNDDLNNIFLRYERCRRRRLPVRVHLDGVLIWRVCTRA